MGLVLHRGMRPATHVWLLPMSGSIIQTVLLPHGFLLLLLLSFPQRRPSPSLFLISSNGVLPAPLAFVLLWCFPLFGWCAFLLVPRTSLGQHFFLPLRIHHVLRP